MRKALTIFNITLVAAGVLGFFFGPTVKTSLWAYFALLGAFNEIWFRLWLSMLREKQMELDLMHAHIIELKLALLKRDDNGRPED